MLQNIDVDVMNFLDRTIVSMPVLDIQFTLISYEFNSSGTGSASDVSSRKTPVTR